MSNTPKNEYTITRHDGLKAETVLADSYRGTGSGQFQFFVHGLVTAEAVAYFDRVSGITHRENPAIAKAKAEADKAAKKKKVDAANAIVGKAVQVDPVKELNSLNERFERYRQYAKDLRATLVDAIDIACAENRFGARAKALDTIADLEIPDLPLPGNTVGR